MAAICPVPRTGLLNTLGLSRRGAVVSRRRKAEGQVGEKLLPGSFIDVPIGCIRQRRDRHEFALIETSESRIYQVVCPHHHLTGQFVQ